MIKLVADGQKRNLSNFIEFATMQYLTSSQFVEKNEMSEILEDKELVNNLMNELKDVKKLKTETKKVNVDFPEWIVESLDKEAKKIGVLQDSLS